MLENSYINLCAGYVISMDVKYFRNADFLKLSLIKKQKLRN